ncbi:hypothetical protein [Brevundimonas sp.]|uniref:hypothetical protein n=1 Tax=Brevundimonas sp. TaxID=1871086 RepID=UPI00289D1766|nr:hypothetical protein [Brevundimonas sp.]
MDRYSRAIASISKLTDLDQLRNFRNNALSEGATEVADAAFKRLVSLCPSEAPGSIEHDFWSTIHAFEELLREERGKTVRLSRTRQKISRVGVIQTLIDFAKNKTPTDGFLMLIERGLPELTGEALILKHKDVFEYDVQQAATQRLEAAAVNIEELIYSFKSALALESATNSSLGRT